MKSKKSKSHTKPKAKASKKSTALGIATTLKAGAAITGLPMVTLKTLKASGSKAFKANGRIDCDQAKADAAKIPTPQTNSVDFFLEQALDMQVKRRLGEQKLGERAKELRPIAGIRRAWFRNVIAAKTKFYSAENTIAVEAGMKLALTPVQIADLREIIKKHQRPAIRELHQGELGKVECPECKKEIA